MWLIALEDGYHILGEPADGEAIRHALQESSAGRDTVLRDIRDATFALALIGPDAEKVAWKAFGDEVHSIAFLNVLPLGDPAVMAARIGYFGEYELHLFADISRKRAVIDALEQAAGGHSLMVGTDALPVMMTEMGTLSRERDVPPDVSVFEAGLQWMIDFRKDGLRMAAELEHRKQSIRRKCVLMTVDGSATDLPDQPVFIEDCDVGRVQSAFHSETLGRSVAFAYLSEDLAVPGLTCAVGFERRTGETVSAPAFLGRSILDTLG